jgi:predicted  nucleic acid-binding Zn-ribbon protein
MSDLKHDLSVLVSIAKLDATLTDFRGELSRLPDRIKTAEKSLARVETAEKNAIADFEAKVKERRSLETELQDSEVRINKFRGDLMQAGSNKEYQACQKEIANLEEEIDTKEERLLVLMDELDDRRTEHEAELRNFAENKKQKTDEIKSLQDRMAFLGAEIDRLDNEKPAYLREINPKLRTKYERLLANLGSQPAARVENESCGGCGVKLPPQLVVEVRDNEQLLTCQGCGRILIHYVD